MKKILSFLFFLSLITSSTLNVQALTFEEAFAQSSKKPVVVLVYAQWADGYQNQIEQFRKVQTKLNKHYNFVELDIANKDAKSFNSKYNIYPNLPYVIMFREGGKISRYVQRDCSGDDRCLESKLRSFLM